MKENNWISKMFTHSVYMINRMSYLRKFILIAILFTIPLLTLFYFLFTETDKQINFTEKEKVGLEYIKLASDLMQNIQQHRGVTSAYLSGDMLFANAMTQKMADIEGIIIKINELKGLNDDDDYVNDQWLLIKKEWNKLKTNNLSMSVRESFDFHTELIKNIFFYLRYVSDASNLILDPESESYHLINMVVNLVPELTEQLGQMRARGVSAIVFNESQLSEEDKNFLGLLITSTRLISSKIDAESKFVLKKNSAAKKMLETVITGNKNEIENILKLMEDSLDKGKFSITSTEYFTKITNEIDQLFVLSVENMLPAIKDLLDSRIHRETARRNWAVVIAALSMIIVLYVFSGFYFSVRKTISELAEISDGLMKGERVEKMKLSTKDELGHIGDMFGNVATILMSTNKTLANDIAKREETERKLNARTDELEKINDFMIGRELKMSALKNEIKELRAMVEKKD